MLAFEGSWTIASSTALTEWYKYVVSNQQINKNKPKPLVARLFVLPFSPQKSLNTMNWCFLSRSFWGVAGFEQLG